MKTRNYKITTLICVLSAITVLFSSGCTIELVQATNSQSNQAKPITQPIVEPVSQKPAVNETIQTSTTPLIKWLEERGCQNPDKSEYDNGEFKVTWTENDKYYVGQLLLQGYKGRMRIKVNENNYVDQDFLFQKCSKGYYFVGFGAVDADTRNPIKDYQFNDNFKFSYTPTGEIYIQRCSDTDVCVDAKMEKWGED